MKYILTILLTATISLTAFAQEAPEENSKKGFDWDRVFYGGNMGLRVNEAFFVDLSPLVGYQFTERLSAGPGITYRYFKYPETPGFSVYGGRVFGRFDISKPFFLYTEYETLSLATFSAGADEPTGRNWIPSWFAGGGLLQPVGRNVGISIVFLYNMLYDPADGLYARPYVVRAGFVILPRF